MPVTSQIPLPRAAPGSSVDVSVAAPPAGVLIHSDGEHRFQGKTIDEAGNELCPGPRSFPLSGAGMHTIDIRVFNLMSTSIDSLVTATLRDSAGNIVAGPFPAPRPVPATDHHLVTILALVSGVATPATKPRKPGKKKSKKKGP
jgi:hypothetical protein